MRELFDNPFHRQLTALLLLLLCAPLLWAGAKGSFSGATAGLALFAMSLGLTLWNPRKKRGEPTSRS